MPRKTRSSVLKRPRRQTRPRRITAMAMPRMGDILRGEPTILQNLSFNLLNLLRGTTEEYNKERVSGGMRPVDYPGRPRSGKTNRAPAPRPMRASTGTSTSASRPPVRRATVPGLDGKPKTHLYRGDKLVKRPSRGASTGGARVI